MPGLVYCQPKLPVEPGGESPLGPARYPFATVLSCVVGPVCPRLGAWSHIRAALLLAWWVWAGPGRSVSPAGRSSPARRDVSRPAGGGGF